MKKAFAIAVISAGLAGFGTSVAHAALVGGIPPPASVLPSGATNSAPQGFDEKRGVTLTAPLQVDGGTIPAGTVVDSHMIFLNPSAGNTINYNGASFTFDGDILGVMSDTNGAREVASTALLGAPGTTYPTVGYAGRGLEAGTPLFPFGTENYSVSGKTLGLSLTGSDYLRVITRSVPAVTTGPAGRCIVAKSGGDFATIAAATASSRCAGGLIKVMPGTYVENVNIGIGQHLLGAGRGLTIIQAANAAAPVITPANKAIIEGFTLTGGTSTVFLSCSGCAGATVRIVDNDISGGTTNGIAMTQYANAVIENNSIHDTPTAVNFYQYANPTLRNNVLYNVNIGVNLYYANAIIDHNRIVTKGGASDHGIYIGYSTANVNFNVVDKITNSYGTLTGKYNVTPTGALVGP